LVTLPWEVEMDVDELDEGGEGSDIEQSGTDSDED
jgi:hypothetical protein